MSDHPPPSQIEIDDTLPPGVGSTSYCPPLALLRAHQERVLPSTLTSEINEHLQHCGLCTMLVADLEHVPQPALTADERQRIRHTIPSPLRTPNWRWYTGFASAAALILATVFLVFHHPKPNQTTQTVQSDQHQPATLPQKPDLEIAKLDPPIELAPGLVLRGTTSSDQPTPADLAPAFSAYTQNNYSLAAERFSRLAKQFPRSDIPFLYLGVTQLLQDDATAALPNLVRAEYLARSSHKDSAAWYRALAAIQARSPEASALLDAICRNKTSVYTSQACLLEKN
jgi:hypothetical protein